MKSREHIQAGRQTQHVRTRDKSDVDMVDDGKQGKMPFRYGNSQKGMCAKQGEIFSVKFDLESLNV